MKIASVKPMDRQEKIEYLAFFVLIGFFLAIVYHYLLIIYWHATYPANTFLFFGVEFSDLYVSLLQDLTFAPYTSEVAHAQYFPFAYLLIYPLMLLNIHLAAIVYLVIFSLAFFLLVNFYLKKKTSTFAERLAQFKNVFILSFLTYPFLFNIERANLENIVFIFVAVSFYFYAKQKRLLTAFFLAMASAIKLYPLFLALFFVADKKYYEAFLSGILAIFLMLISLMLFHPGFLQNYHEWTIALQGLQGHISLNPESCIRFNLGLWGLLKYILFDCYHWPNNELMSVFALYHRFILFCVPLLAAYVIFIEKTPWHKLALLVFGIMLFPEMSNDYKLIYLYLPLASFLSEKPRANDAFYLVLFALLLIPKNYYLLSENVSVANMINQGVILLMSFRIIGAGIYKKCIHCK